MSSIHGYVPYRPGKYARSVLRAVKAVLIEYEAWESPLTVRQVFYRLIAEYGYPKTEQAYGSLGGYMARSRRAYQDAVIEGVRTQGLKTKEANEAALESDVLIPFAWVRDEKGHSVQESAFDNEEDFLDSVRDWAENMKLDRMQGQDYQIELWCEAAGMVPLMREIAEPYGVRVSSGGGYDSVTAKHQLATRVVREYGNNRRPTLVLHIGDFDPSGEGMYETLRDDVGQMVADYGVPYALTVRRVALTEDQVIEWNVETAPPKPLDSRARGFVDAHPDACDHFGSEDITAQLEALTPPDLRRLMTEALEGVIDQDAYDGVLAEEREIRERLAERLAD